MSDLPVYAPTTHEERAFAYYNGTPAGFRPYVPTDPDPLRDGLLRGFWEARRILAERKA